MNKEQFDRIESYLRDTLSEADKRSFEADLETDANLRKEWELHQKLNLGLRAMAIEKQLLNARQRANQRIKTPPVRRTNNVFQIWSVAASVVLVLGLGWWVWQSQARSQWSDLAEQEMTDIRYKSLPLDSLQALTKAADQQQAREKAEWYVALAYLKKGRKKEAKDLLTTISNNPQHAYAPKAKKLLEQGFN